MMRIFIYLYLIYLLLFSNKLISSSQVVDENPQFPFVDVTDKVKLNITHSFLNSFTDIQYHGIGQAFGDYDNDGDLDLYLTDQNGPNSLLEFDNGEYKLSNIGDILQLSEYDSGGAIFADYDNDRIKIYMF